jgi:hypothetical protein
MNKPPGPGVREQRRYSLEAAIRLLSHSIQTAIFSPWWVGVTSGHVPAAVLTGRFGSTGVARWLAYGAPLAGLTLYVASRCVWYLALRRHGSVGG